MTLDPVPGGKYFASISAGFPTDTTLSTTVTVPPCARKISASYVYKCNAVSNADLVRFRNRPCQAGPSCLCVVYWQCTCGTEQAEAAAAACHALSERAALAPSHVLVAVAG